jgi:hypothetical protein
VIFTCSGLAHSPTSLPLEYVFIRSDRITQETWDRFLGINTFFSGTGISAPVLVSLSHVESRHDVNAVSPVGAVGNMQFMLKTAKAMAASDCRDLGRMDRRNPAWAIPCGARLLEQNLRIIKTYNTECDHIQFALRAYNEGVGWTLRAQKKAKDPGDIGSVERVSIKSKANERQTDEYPKKVFDILPSYVYSGVLGTNLCGGH